MRQARKAVRSFRDRRVFEEEFFHCLCERFPACPSSEAWKIARFSCSRRTERVGALSFDGQGYLEESVELAVVAHLRHRFTNYEALLDLGIHREEARAIVAPEVARLLRQWLGVRALTSDALE